MIWIVFAAMTVLAALAVLVPLARAGGRGGDAPAADIAVYGSQLVEIDRDLARGLIAEPEAGAAKAEIGRRLLRAARDPGRLGGAEGTGSSTEAAGRRRLKVAALSAAIGIPALVLAFYAAIGRPEMPDEPLASRAVAEGDIDALVARVEARLASQPEDGRGWTVIAPIYLRLGRAGEAATAYRNAIRLIGTTPALEAGLGEALVAEAGGIVTEAARQAFNAALAGDPKAVKPRFYLALSLSQAGERDVAVAAWKALLADSRGDEPWAEAAREQLALLEGGAPSQTGGGIPAGGEAIAGMAPEAQRAAIEGMVSGLDQRLAADGGTPDEWSRLIRAYSVLKRPDDAKRAVERAKAALPGEAKAFDELAASLGLGP